MTQIVSEFKEMFAEQVQFRDLLYQMTRRDLLLRYKQTVMGFGWAIFTPLVNTVIFSVVFTKVTTLDTGYDVPYPVFSYAGLLVWNFFAQSLRFSVSSLTANTNLVGKVYFPREIFPFSTVIVAAVDLAVGSSLLVAMMIYYRVPAHAAFLFLPVVFVVEAVFTAAVALVLAMANLFYRDVKYIFEVAITVWMFGSSAVYPVDKIGGWLGVAIKLNPMTTIIDAYRAILFRGELPPLAPFAAVAVFSCFCLAFGWRFFHRSEFLFAESL